jgi:3-oxoacyl-[acyl-carrier protein] reductase
MGLMDGKVVVVTGGGNGIGRAYCQGIAKEGGSVVVGDINGAAATGVAKAIADSGGKSVGVEVDVANSASCKDMANKSLGSFGEIDGLINNAAIFMTVPVTKGGWRDIDEQEWDRVMAVNVKGLWLSSRAVVPAMQQRKQGSIVNISSNMAFNGGLTMMHYVTSKAAVVGFSRVLAQTHRAAGRLGWNRSVSIVGFKHLCHRTNDTCKRRSGAALRKRQRHQ